VSLKVPIYRSEDLRYAATRLRCVRCGAAEAQAAHIGGLAEGKGRGLKVADSRIAALCPDRFGALGCHTLIDQHKVECDPWELIAKTYIALVEAGALEVAKSWRKPR
jgi:hypothetical protein